MAVTRERALAIFWSKVDKGGAGECWPWLGTLQRGYGVANAPLISPTRQAHRISYELLAVSYTHLTLPTKA